MALPKVKWWERIGFRLLWTGRLLTPFEWGVVIYASIIFIGAMWLLSEVL